MRLLFGFALRLGHFAQGPCLGVHEPSEFNHRIIRTRHGAGAAFVKPFAERHLADFRAANKFGSPVARGFAAENLAATRRLAINLLRRDQTCKRSIKGKLLRAAIDPDYLKRILSS